MRKKTSLPDRPRTEFRCAVYTRKSSEEGLEQEFNSLHAQRDACLAYIQSQRHEGWKALPTLYDDGGISGGTLERPALARLLDDIRAKRVDLVIIYKVDRLTRSLADFAKLVDVFNDHNVSFVSVTQQFNTATSMGRLTLNMLLSFAQFEREVTGERIRDKIAASKRKGMWMGGNTPLGYDVADRKLVINQAEARDVRRIFEAYIELGSVRLLMARAASTGITTKRRAHAGGKLLGGLPFSRGNLYQMLQNPIYLGKISHKGEVYDGEHAAIIDQSLWDQVQSILAGHRVEREPEAGERQSLLAGMIFDEAGNRLTPTHAKKATRRYRYYVSSALITATKADAPASLRLPAGETERLVIQVLRDLVATPARVLDFAAGQVNGATEQRRLLDAASRIAGGWEQMAAAGVAFWVRRVVARVVVRPGEIAIDLYQHRLIKLLLDRDERDGNQSRSGYDNGIYTVVAPCSLRRVGKEMRLVITAPSREAEADPALLRLLAQAVHFKQVFLASRGEDILAMAKQVGVSGSHFTRSLRLGFLAPDIITAIVEGRQPRGLTATKLCRDVRVPFNWAEQRQMLGLPGPQG